MGIAKKIIQRAGLAVSLDNIFIFLFLAIFPFGQIVRLSFNFAGYNVPIHPIDIIVGLGATYSLLFQRQKPKIFLYFRYFVVIVFFSYILSISVFGKDVLYGFFYLLRRIAYFLFLSYVWNFVRKSQGAKKILVDSLLAISVVSAVFGWMQFFLVPDIRPFFVYNWDMHLYRLVGTFLDPSFLGLIIVFGLIISLYRYISEHENKYILVSVFLLLSLAFTYSRASFVAFGAGVAVLAILHKKYRKIVIWILGLVFIASLLPTARNQTIRLDRTFSIFSRVANYSQTLTIFKKHPVFGVGFNNLCVARNKYIGIEDFSSHACSGSDSSILFILATTGVVGLMIFLGSVYWVFKQYGKSREFRFITPIIAALFVHSFFSNSIFFPWVMGYMSILLGASLKE